MRPARPWPAWKRKHGERRAWVWARLGLAPMAAILKPLGSLATAAQQALGGSEPADVADAYLERGWQADLGAWQAVGRSARCRRSVRGGGGTAFAATVAGGLGAGVSGGARTCAPAGRRRATGSRRGGRRLSRVRGRFALRSGATSGGTVGRPRFSRRPSVGAGPRCRRSPAQGNRR